MATTTALQTRKRDALFFCQVTFCFIPSPLFWFVGLLYSCSNHTECNPIFHSRLQFTNSLQALSTVYMYNFQSAFSTNHITIYTQLWHYTNLSCSARLLQRHDLQIFSTKVRCLMGPLLEHNGFYIHGSAFIQNSLLIITTALLYIATVTFSHYKQAAEYCRQTLT